jgi:hypothetical protein
MNTKNYYPENANRAKAIFVAGLLLIQVTLFAGENTSNYTLEEATESEIELEDWMSDVHSSFWYDLADAQEEEMAIENWMCDVKDSFWYDLTDATEPEMVIEDWMCDVQNSFWLDLTDAEESELAIESWMTNPDAWTTTGDEVILSSL